MPTRIIMSKAAIPSHEGAYSRNRRSSSLLGHNFARLVEGRGWRLPWISGSRHIYGKEGTATRFSIPIHGNGPFKIGLLTHWELARLLEVKRIKHEH